MAKRILQLVLLSLVLCPLLGWKTPEGVELVGRFDVDGSRQVFRANWPATGLRFTVDKDPLSAEDNKGDSAMTVRMSFEECAEACKFFVGVFVDGEQASKHEINANASSLSFSLSAQRHSVELLKLTESRYSEAKGIMQLGELSVTGGRIVANNNHNNNENDNNKRKKIFVIGDSLTAAYGVDGAMPCYFSAATEDVSHGYAMLVARALALDISLIAWSGKGVVRNYGDVRTTSINPMPTFYNRTLSTSAATDRETNYWRPARFPADLVMVMLGSNDYSTDPMPADEEFVRGYLAFLAQIHADYRQAALLLLCAPRNRGPQCANIEQAAKLFRPATVNFFAIPPSTLEPGFGCDSHPNQASMKLIAQSVQPVVQQILGL